MGKIFEIFDKYIWYIMFIPFLIGICCGIYGMTNVLLTSIAEENAAYEEGCDLYIIKNKEKFCIKNSILNNVEFKCEGLFKVECKMIYIKEVEKN